MAHLLLEISSEIFVQSLVPFPEPGALHAPMLLRSICNGWSDIALSTPELWAATHINFPCAQGLGELLPIWFERAHNQPLFISLEGTFDQYIAAIILGHGQKLKHLQIRAMEGNNSNIDRRLWESGPELLPALETLTLSDVYGDWFELLRQAPNLRECYLYDVQIVRVDRRGTSERLALPALRRLMSGEEERLPRAGDDILDYLSLPGLEALSISSDHLLSFLQRSSPPLLELVWGPSVLDSIPLATLRLIPDVRRLEMWWPRYEAVEKLLEALAQSLSLLPHLSTLIIHVGRSQA